MEEHKNETHTICPSCKQPFWFPNEGLGMTAPCPHCGRDVELVARGQTAAVGEAAASAAKKPGTGFYVLLVCIVVGLIVLGYGAWSSLKSMQGPKEKTPAQFRNEANPLLVQTASNQIVGFKRIRFADVDYHSEFDNPNAWTGNVEAEYTNPNGGVSVTNLSYKFGLQFDGENKLSCTWR